MTVDKIEKRGEFIPDETIEPGPDGLIEVPNQFEPIQGPWVIAFDLEVGGGTLVEVDETGDRAAGIHGHCRLDAANP